jgi:hypothetical protein
MENIVIYCKSYINDVERVIVQAHSIEQFNVDNIPYYVSCPSKDYNIFKQRLPSFVNIIKDEDILGYEFNQNWNTQQIVKSQFYKYIDTINYVCIDSDSYFIKPFFKNDFIVHDDIPYTVMHQQKNLFQWTSRYKRELGFDPQQSFDDCRLQIGNIFNRTFKVNYDFGPSPIIWSRKVWESLEENYLKVNNLTFDQLIEFVPSEFTWYGEALLAFKAIEIYPIEPLFMVFHYPLQYQQFLQQGYTEQDLASCYMGVIMTSNWSAPLRYNI